MEMPFIRRLIIGLSLCMLSAAGFSDEQKITVNPVRDNIYMLNGEGGNVGLFVGEDGSFLIDDKFAPLSDEIIKAIKSVGGDIPKFLVNTHFHGDHTGGNENFGESGSIIVAQDNVRRRLSTEQVNEALGSTTPPSPDSALPVITFAESMSFHWNGDTLDVIHIPHAHTDGDAIIHFIGANVIHTGDVVFNGMFPFLDYSAGGSIAGMVAGTEKVLSFVNDDTVIIPGHGPLANKKDLQTYLQMLKVSMKRVSTLKEDGKTLDEIVAMKPLADYDGFSWSFINTDMWVKLVYKTL